MKKNFLNKEKDKITFYDNYAAIKVIPELKKQISKLVLEDYSECKIHISFHKEWIQENINLYNSAEEFLKKDTYWKHSMTTSVFILDEKLSINRLKEFSKNVFRQLGDNNFQGITSIYFYNNYYYDKINNSPIHHYSWDMTFQSATCGKDFIYSWCSLEKGTQQEIHFEDN